MLSNFKFDINDKVIHIWKVEEANAFINTNRVRKVKYAGEEHTFYSDEKVFKYNILLNDDTQDTIYVDDIVTVDVDKIVY